MAITHPSTLPTTNQTKPPSPPKHPPQITLHPLTKSDLPRLSLLEHLAFEHDEFSDLAFGRERGSVEGLRLRSEQLGKFLERADCWFVKAVLGGGDEGEIIGVAGWMSGGGGEGKGERNEESGDGDGKLKEEGRRKGDEVLEVSDIPKVKTKEELEKIWGKGGNFKLCEDVFVRADEYMFKACGKERWLKLNLLVIHPNYQRQGIGTRLLTQGLQLADSGEIFPPFISSQTCSRTSSYTSSPTSQPSPSTQTHPRPHPQPKSKLKPPIQVILGASPWGIGLYRKHGFQEVYSMDIRLDIYEGGEGMGRTSHVIMRRGPCGVCEGGRQCGRGKKEGKEMKEKKEEMGERGGERID